MDKNDTKCPTCGEDNHCVMAAGKPAETCWCVSVSIPAEALEAIPEADRGKRCICPACAGANTGES